MTRAPSSVRSTTGAVYAVPKPKPKAARPHPSHPHTTPKPAACHCSPTPHHPCAHTPGQVVKTLGDKRRAAYAKSQKLAAMTPGDRKALVAKRRATAVKAAATRAAHKKAAKLANPHKPAAKKPAKKAC